MLDLLSGSIFLRKTDNTPIQSAFDWPSAFDTWTVETERVVTPLWSPVTYVDGGGRVKGGTEANITAVYAIVLDFDGKQGTVTLDDAFRVMPDVEACAHTTWRHTPDAPRFRFIMPLTRAVTTSDFRRIWSWVQSIYKAANAVFDPLSDPGRLYYMPVHPPDAAHEFRYRPGTRLNPDEILRIAPVLPEAAGRVRRTPTPASDSPVVQRVFASRDPSEPTSGLFAGIESANQTENLDRIEEQCAWMRHCREDAATLPEPEWYAWLSILARCKDGEQHAHEIGRAHTGYSRAETSEKFHRAGSETGPRTCAVIRELGTACEGCTLGAPVGTITSPVMLGRPNPQTATTEELREDAVTRSESDIERARAVVAAAEEQVSRFAIEESVTRTRANTARRFGMEDTIRTEVAAHVAAQDRLRDAREQVRVARNVLRSVEARASRTAALTQADPRVVNDLLLDPRSGIPRSSLANVETILRGDAAYAGNHFRYCEFSQRLYYGQSQAADHLDTTINIDIERRYNITSRTQLVQEAVMSLARTNAFHPVREYLRSVEWDGQARLAELFATGFGAVGSSLYLEEAGTKFMVGAVARVMKPGCKLDTMVVLVGSQGARKSTGLRTLAKGWFADSTLPVGDKDSYLLLLGKWLYEIGELDSFKKAENTRIKAFLSSQEDYFRPPFGRHTIECPRQTVLVGSTNEDQFLTDPTGSRRFVPIRVSVVNVEWLAQHRDQLWAEAFVRYNAGTSWWYENDSAERLARESEPFQQDDVWASSVYEYVVRRKTSTVTVTDVLTAGLAIDIARATRSDKLRVSHLLKHFGCVLQSDTPARGAVYSVPESMLNVVLMEKPSVPAHPLPKWASPKPAAAPSTPHPDGPLY